MEYISDDFTLDYVTVKVSDTYSGKSLSQLSSYFTFQIESDIVQLTWMQATDVLFRFFLPFLVCMSNRAQDMLPQSTSPRSVSRWWIDGLLTIPSK